MNLACYPDLMLKYSSRSADAEQIERLFSTATGTIVKTGYPGPDADASEASAKVLLPCSDAPHRSEWLEGGFALLDLAHCVVHANAELVNWLGIRQEEALGVSLDSLLQRSCLGIEEVLQRAWSESSPCAEYHFQLLLPLRYLFFS